MKTTLNKSVKRVLSLCLAIVVAIGSLFVANVGVNINASAEITEKNYDDWDGTRSLDFSQGDGSSSNPYLIETAEQLAGVILSPNHSYADGNYYDASGSKLLTADDTLESAGKYFVVKANSVFNMNGMKNIM